MLNINLDGDIYVLNIILPNTKFNYELLNRLVGLVGKQRDSVVAQVRHKDFAHISKTSEKVLTILKLLNYG